MRLGYILIYVPSVAESLSLIRRAFGLSRRLRSKERGAGAFLSLVRCTAVGQITLLTRMQLSPQIAGLVSIVLGLGSGAYLLYTLIRQHASKRWPKTTGEVLESQLEEDADGWGPYVRYGYSVKEKHYVNDRLYFYLSNRSTEHEARKHLLPYPVGKVVTIYYNPRSPANAVLDRRMPLWRPLFWLFFASFWLVAAAAMLHD